MRRNYKNPIRPKGGYNETNWFLEKINKINKHLAKLTKRRKET
jgi:hypothetical protein